MRFQIRKIILWPRTKKLKPRIVEFTPGKLNVVTGASKTGKSAIIPIVDYCLASDKCAIPVDTIRDAASWFGLIAETATGEILLARRGPETQKSTGEMYMVEGAKVDVPDEISDGNTNSDAVKRHLDGLSGISRLDFDFEKLGSGFRGRPSFRDLMAFCFQPQNVIANPDVFFFKADTSEHREKLKTIFPYVLNAVTPDTLAAQHELDSVRRELARKEKELANLRRVSQQWLAELRSWVVEARELGLLQAPVAESASRDDLIALLRVAASATPQPSPTLGQIDEAVKELVALQREDAEVATRLSVLRRRYAEMERLKESGGAYRSALRGCLHIGAGVDGGATERRGP